MRDDEGGAAGHDAVHRLEDFVLGPGIDRGGGIIEDKDGRIEQDGSGEGEALALAAGKVAAILMKEGVVAQGQLFDELVRGGEMGGTLDLLAGGAGIAEGDVRGNGRAEEETLLEDQPHLPTDVIEPPVAQVASVEDKASGVGIVETRHELDHGRLPRSGRSDDGDLFPGPDLQGKIVEDGVLRLEAERDVFEGDLAAGASERCASGPIDDTRLGVEDLVDAVRSGEGLLQAVGDRADRGDLGIELLEDAGEEDESRANGDLAADREPTAVA